MRTILLQLQDLRGKGYREGASSIQLKDFEAGAGFRCAAARSAEGGERNDLPGEG